MTTARHVPDNAALPDVSCSVVAAEFGPTTAGPTRSALAAQFYYEMYLIRTVERRFLELFEEGLLNGTVHTSLGQEACAVGVINALDTARDVIFSNHRAHGHFLAYCGDVDGLVAEILGRRTGVCGGIGGSQHLHTSNLYTNGIQGGIVPCAVGAALAEKLDASGAITVVFLGDGTMGQGSVYEAMNVAALWSLPVLFVLEDNQYAQSTPKHLQHAGDLSTRPATFGIPAQVVDAEDVFRVHAAAQDAVQIVRGACRPFFLALSTYRLGPHSKGDDLRPVDELHARWARDPLVRLAAELPDDRRRAIEEAVRARTERAVGRALEEESLTFEEFQDHVRWPTT
jgi:TPP-dependent pyruvate/acetoin dehydrogenase alpha subunit